MKTMQIEEMSWTEFEVAAGECDLIVVPAGSTEQHGLHCPLGVDTSVALHCARMVGEEARALVGPVLPFGYAESFLGYPGTISIDADLLTAVLVSYAESYIKHGARRFLFINGHGGNVGSIEAAMALLLDRHGCVSAHTEWWTTLPHINPKWTCDDHAGHFETSVMMAVDPELVAMERAAEAIEVKLTDGIVQNRFRGVRLNLPVPLNRRTNPGNMGRPVAGANAALGTEMIRAYVDLNIRLVEELRAIPLDT